MGLKLTDTCMHVQIGFDNVASISLFEHRLGFAEVSRCEHFEEVTLEVAVTSGGGSGMDALFVKLQPANGQYARPAPEK